MDHIKDYAVVIVLAIIGIVRFLKALGVRARDENNPAHSEEDDIQYQEPPRRAPRAAVPPPLPGGSMPGLERSAVPSLRRPNKQQNFQTSEISREMARQAALTEQIRRAKEAKAARKKITLVSPSISTRGLALNVPGTTLRSRLSDRDELRKAFVLKEILEKPVALRS